MLNFAHGYQRAILPLYQCLTLLSRWMDFNRDKNRGEIESSTNPEAYLTASQEPAQLVPSDADMAFSLTLARRHTTDLMR